MRAIPPPLCDAKIRALRLHTDLQFLRLTSHAACISIRHFRVPPPPHTLPLMGRAKHTITWALMLLPVTPRALRSLLILFRLPLAASLVPTRKNRGAGALLTVPKTPASSLHFHSTGDRLCLCLQLSPPPCSQPCLGPQFAPILILLFPQAGLSPPGLQGPPGPGEQAQTGKEKRVGLSPCGAMDHTRI